MPQTMGRLPGAAEVWSIKSMVMEYGTPVEFLSVWDVRGFCCGTGSRDGTSSYGGGMVQRKMIIRMLGRTRHG
jgi:hypothetical protein